MTEVYLKAAISEMKQSFADSAIKLFCRNPTWRTFHDNAPKRARQYIGAMFIEGVMPWIGPTDCEWNAISSMMTTEDWLYLCNQSHNQMSRAFYRKAAAMTASGKTFTAHACEILNPFVIAS